MKAADEFMLQETSSSLDKPSQSLDSSHPSLTQINSQLPTLSASTFSGVFVPEIKNSSQDSKLDNENSKAQSKRLAEPVKSEPNTANLNLGTSQTDEKQPFNGQQNCNSSTTSSNSHTSHQHLHALTGRRKINRNPKAFYQQIKKSNKTQSLKAMRNKQSNAKQQKQSHLDQLSHLVPVSGFNYNSSNPGDLFNLRSNFVTSSATEAASKSLAEAQSSVQLDKSGSSSLSFSTSPSKSVESASSRSLSSSSVASLPNSAKNGKAEAVDSSSSSIKQQIEKELETQLDTEHLSNNAKKRKSDESNAVNRVKDIDQGPSNESENISKKKKKKKKKKSEKAEQEQVEQSQKQIDKIVEAETDENAVLESVLNENDLNQVLNDLSEALSKTSKASKEVFESANALGTRDKVRENEATKSEKSSSMLKLEEKLKNIDSFQKVIYGQDTASISSLISLITQQNSNAMSSPLMTADKERSSLSDTAAALKSSKKAGAKLDDDDDDDDEVHKDQLITIIMKQSNGASLIESKRVKSGRNHDLLKDMVKKFNLIRSKGGEERDEDFYEEEDDDDDDDDEEEDEEDDDEDDEDDDEDDEFETSSHRTPLVEEFLKSINQDEENIIFVQSLSSLATKTLFSQPSSESSCQQSTQQRKMFGRKQEESKSSSSDKAKMLIESNTIIRLAGNSPLAPAATPMPESPSSSSSAAHINALLLNFKKEQQNLAKSQAAKTILSSKKLSDSAAKSNLKKDELGSEASANHSPHPHQTIEQINSLFSAISK